MIISKLLYELFILFEVFILICAVVWFVLAVIGIGVGAFFKIKGWLYEQREK